MITDFLNRELELGDIVIFADTPSSEYSAGIIYKFGKGTVNLCYSPYGLTKRKDANFVIKITEEELINSNTRERWFGYKNNEILLMVSLSRTIKNIPLNDFEPREGTDWKERYNTALERIKK